MWVWQMERGRRRYWALFSCLLPWIRELCMLIYCGHHSVQLCLESGQRDVSSELGRREPFRVVGIISPPLPPFPPVSVFFPPVCCVQIPRRVVGELLTQDLFLLRPQRQGVLPPLPPSICFSFVGGGVGVFLKNWGG